MKKIIYYCLVFLGISLISCKSKSATQTPKNSTADFVIAFGSCNKQYQNNVLYSEIKKNKPDLWIWGGDNIYSDTDDMSKMKKDYEDLRNQKGYQEMIKDIPVLATWDDHDYGINDGGYEFQKKHDAQTLFLDFFGVSENSNRRKRAGVYHSKIFSTQKGSVKVIMLDTRFFRTALTPSDINKKRYKPNNYGEGTILGKKQWQWLSSELKNSDANFNIIVSSIQFLSAEHGFETWGNFPHEVEKLEELLRKNNKKNVVLVSGDRHISEFSKTKIKGLPYALIDFTSSGLTHSYSNYSGEPNKYRIQNVVSEISFGVLKFDFNARKITMQMRGEQNKLLQELTEFYP